MSLRLVLFDVDGTLVDSQGSIVAAMTAAFGGAGLAVPERDAILSIVGLSLDHAMARLAPDLGRDRHDALVAGYKAAYFAQRQLQGAAHSPLYPGALEVLHRLSAIPGLLLGVATGKSRRGLEALLGAHGLDGKFITRQVADDHPSKPHPSMIEAAMAETGVHRDDTVMIGDTSFDMDMARAAGVTGIGVSWGYHPRRQLGAAARVIDRFAELPGALDEILESPGMTDWKAKRFWKQVAVTPEADGFAIDLDGRRVRTPAKATLILPTRAMAEAVADEWQAQDGRIDPLSMPVTRSANAAIDKVRPQHAEVAAMLAAYGDADLLCYRAEAPEGLSARQSEAWDPVLGWAETALGARLAVFAGVIHRPQAPEMLDLLSARVHALTPFQLAAFHDLVSLSGSLILGFAAAQGWRDADSIWELSRVDEKWQEEQWGPDDEARQAAETKRRAFLHARRFYEFSGSR